MTFDQLTAAVASASELSFDPTESNLNRLLKSNAQVEQYSEEDEVCRKELGDVVVFDTALLQEFSVKSDGCDVKQQMTGHDSGENESDDGISQQQQQQSQTFNPRQFEDVPEQTYHTPQAAVSSQSLPQCNEFSKLEADSQPNNSKPMASIPQQQEPYIQKKVHVPINEWKSPNPGKSSKQLSVPSSSEDDVVHHNSSFEVEDEEDELDEELERLRLDQERSFKAKLYAFENLAKQEEEAARKAAESYRRRQQSRQAKLAAERSKSLGNIQQSSSSPSSSHQKTPVSTSHSISSSSIPATHQVASFSPESVKSAPSKTQSLESQSKSMTNLNSNSISSDYSLSTNNSSNSTVYNFTEKAQTRSASQDVESPATAKVEPKQSVSSFTSSVQSQKQPQTLVNQVVDYPSSKQLSQSVASSQQQQAQNIYENITPLSFTQVKQQPPQAATQPPSPPQQLPVDPVSDSNAIRNASQKLLHQQQQIYQNQPLPYQSQQQPQHFPLESYPNVPPNFGNYPQYDLMQHPVSIDHPIQPTDSILNDMVINPVPIRGYPIVDDVGLPPIQITKSIQSGSSKPYNQIPVAQPNKQQQQEEEHLYVNQNQLMLNPSGKSTHTSVYPFDFHPNSATYEKYVCI